MASESQQPKFQEGSKAALFLELAQPDDLGFSPAVSVAEFTDQYAKLQFGNGGDWIRQDGSLAKHYNIRRHPEGKGKITHVELQGFRKVNQSQGGMCISGVLKTTEMTPRPLASPLGPKRVGTERPV